MLRTAQQLAAYGLVTAGVDEGQRDESAARLSGYLLRRYVDPGVVRELVGCWNELRCRPPLPAGDIVELSAASPAASRASAVARSKQARRAAHLGTGATYDHPEQARRGRRLDRA
jgi:hypothetical protein